MFHRRHTLQLLGSAALFSALPFNQAGAAGTAARLIVLSDLHSAYENTAQLLAAVAAEVAENPVPHAILINGDVFEVGNVVASRSQGVIDWSFLKRLARLAPCVLNIGNHEPDLVADLSEAVAQARDASLTVLTTIIDRRTGQPYAPPSTELALGGVHLSVVGIATDALNTYPKALRDTLDIPDPVDWARARLGAHLVSGSVPVILSHAGAVADRDILPLLPDGSLLVGGHDHLLFAVERGRTRYFHTGSWSTFYTVVDVAPDGTLAATRKAVVADGPADEELTALIEATLAQHLTDEERAIVATSPKAMWLDESARFVAETMAKAANADVGFIGHTTFGTGFPEGPVSKYRFDAVVRFDGKLVAATIDRATLDQILARTNQDADTPLAARTGDFLHAAPLSLPDKPSYTIVTNDWSALNQKSYFGREDISFAEVPELKVKAVARAALVR